MARGFRIKAFTPGQRPERLRGVFKTRAAAEARAKKLNVAVWVTSTYYVERNHGPQGK